MAGTNPIANFLLDEFHDILPPLPADCPLPCKPEVTDEELPFVPGFTMTIDPSIIQSDGNFDGNFQAAPVAPFMARQTPFQFVPPPLIPLPIPNVVPAQQTPPLVFTAPSSVGALNQAAALAASTLPWAPAPQWLLNFIPAANILHVVQAPPPPPPNPPTVPDMGRTVDWAYEEEVMSEFFDWDLAANGREANVELGLVAVRPLIEA